MSIIEVNLLETKDSAIKSCSADNGCEKLRRIIGRAHYSKNIIKTLNCNSITSKKPLIQRKPSVKLVNTTLVISPKEKEIAN